MILISKARFGMVRSVGITLDHVLTVVSPLVLAALLGVAAAWAFEKAPSQTFVNTANVMSAKTGSDIGVNIPVVVHTEAKRAVYRMYLTDTGGMNVYQFPDQITDNPQRIDLNGDAIRIPDALAPGQYVLHVEIIYPFNPFKNGYVLMSVATLNVTR